jgi:hypothetical protein
VSATARVSAADRAAARLSSTATRHRAVTPVASGRAVARVTAAVGGPVRVVVGAAGAATYKKDCREEK